jgi:hypothetical protein
VIEKIILERKLQMKKEAVKAEEERRQRDRDNIRRLAELAAALRKIEADSIIAKDSQ